MADDPRLALFPHDVRALVATGAFDKAFAILGPPRPPQDPIFVRPSELSASQRALAELIAESEQEVFGAPVPGGKSLRRWLGLDPPGPFEEDITWNGEEVPLWLALQRERSNVEAVLLSLPPATRIEAIGAFAAAHEYEVDCAAADMWWSPALAGVKGEGGAWAKRVLLSSTNTDRWNMHLEHVAFLAGVRAGLPIEPAWERYFPIGSDVSEAVSGECARAFSLERLEPLALQLLAETHGARAIQAALAIVQHHDSPAIARFVIEKSKQSSPRNRKAELAALAAISQTKPGVAALLGGAAKTTSSRALVVSARMAPRDKDLTPLQAKQLVEAGRRFDGKKLPVARRLSLDENDEAAMGAILEHVKVSEGGKPAFEGWLTILDAGTFFQAGTTKVVAERSEGRIEIAGKRDDALADALAEIAASKGASRSVPQVRAATAAARPPKKSSPKK